MIFKKRQKNKALKVVVNLDIGTYLEVGDGEFVVGTKAIFGGIIEGVPCLLARFLTRGAD